MYDVRDYGGSPTGLFDNTTAINQALAAMWPGPGVLLFKGDETGCVFRIDGTLFVQPYVALTFDGACLSLGPGADVKLLCQQDINVKWFGANGTTASTTGTIAASSYDLDVPTGMWFQLGCPIRIEGAGAGGAPLYARVVANDNDVLMLDTPAETSVTDAVVKPADCTAFNQALACHPGPSWFYSIEVPKGIYRVHERIDVPEYTTFHGAGRNNTMLWQDAGNTIDEVLRVSGGVNLLDLFVNALASGKCIGNTGVINDNLYRSIWLAGNVSQGALLSGTCHNLTVTDVIMENAYDGIQLDGNNHLNLSQAVLYDIRHRMITSTAGGLGLNLANVNLEAVQAGAGAIGMELDSYDKINFANVKLSGTEVFDKGFKLSNCNGVRASNVQFSGFVAEQDDQVQKIDCTDVDWND